jgi:SAM-dependent methyltransferase
LNNLPTFADVYDRLFPLSKETLFFLRKHLPIGKILDIGCATGSYLLELERLGYQGKGIDLDPNMIAIAKAKAKQRGLNSKFQVGDMMRLPSETENLGALSIGNTLVHAPSVKAAGRVISGVYQCLKPGGVFILQIINYDRILDQKLDHLPLISYPGINFQRTYEYTADKIVFHSEIQLTETGQILHHTVDLMPIRQGEVIHLLESSGFLQCQAWSGFTDNPFDRDNSLQLVVTCHK